MSILRDAQRVITIVETGSPRLAKSSLWKVARKRLLRSAVALETDFAAGEDDGARESPEGLEENEKCQDLGDQEASSKDLNDMLQRTLRRPLRVISRSSRVKSVPGRHKV